MTARIVLLAVALCAAPAVRAAAPPNPIPAASVETKRLPNGATLVLRNIPAAPVTVVDLWVRAGASDDGGTGAAHALEHMAFKGAKDAPGERVDAVIEETGGVVSAATLPDATHYWVSVLPDQAAAVIRDLPRILREPALDPAAWERERKVILEEIDRAGTDIEAEARRALALKLYGKFASPASGTADAIRALTPDTIRAFHRRRYRPENTVMAITGNFDTDRIRKAAVDALTALPSAAPAPLSDDSAVPDPVSRSAEVSITAKGTVAVGMGFTAPSTNGPALDIAASLLRSRLERSLAGAAATVQVVHPWQRAQLVTVVATGSEADAGRIRSVMRSTVATFPSTITDADRNQAVRNRQWAWWNENESPTAQARILGLATSLGDPDAATLAGARLSLLTTDDIRTAARIFNSPNPQPQMPNP